MLTHDTPLTDGAQLLNAFIRARKPNGLTQARAAEAIGVSGPTMHDWLSGEKRPKASHREKIERWTDGLVPASSWDTPEERKLVERVRPFVKASQSEAA